jgi:NADPH:quinone reductase
MKAVLVRSFANPPALALEEVDRPTLGPGEVRIAVDAAAVGFVDALIASGRYQVRPPLPYIPGTECSGVIIGTAPGDAATGATENPGFFRRTQLRVGDRVAAIALAGGGLAEQIVVPATAVRQIPPSMNMPTAAVFCVSALTAWLALSIRAAAKPGETLFVLGSGGAVGHAAIQVGRALGLHVIAAASSPGKARLARDAGAQADAPSDPAAIREALRTLTGGRGVDIVFDPVGGAATEPAFRSLAWGGRHLVVGFAAGAIPALPTNLALLKGASLVGVDLRQFIEREPAAAEAAMDCLFKLQTAGALSPRIARVHPLTAFQQAFDDLAGAGHGRIVVEVSRA